MPLYIHPSEGRLELPWREVLRRYHYSEWRRDPKLRALSRDPADRHSKIHVFGAYAKKNGTTELGWHRESWRQVFLGSEKVRSKTGAMMKESDLRK